MTTERRILRMQEVLHQRVRWVRCAVEAVYHRHNLSAILRTCDALGVHDVHIVGANFGSPSKGPARGAERWLSLREHQDPEAAITAIKADGYRIYVADLQGEPLLPEEIPLDQPVVLWFGAELVGVSKVAREAADGVLYLPMRGMAQSLNVSVAAALAMRPVVERARAEGPHVWLTPERQREILEGWQARELGFTEAARERTSNAEE